MRYIQKFRVVKRVAQAYNSHKQKCLRSLRLDWCLRKIRWIFKRLLRRKGSASDVRSTKLIKNSFVCIPPMFTGNFYAHSYMPFLFSNLNNFLESMMKRCKPLLITFLEQTAHTFEFKNKILKCHNLLTK